MDCPSPFGQAERSIDGNKVGLCLEYRVQYVFIAERDVRLRPQAAQKAHTCRTARRTGEVDPEHDKRFTVLHDDSFIPPPRGSFEPEPNFLFLMCLFDGSGCRMSLDLLPEFERLRNVRKGFLCATGPDDDNSAVTKYST